MQKNNLIKMNKLKSIIPALLTPFTSDNRINHSVLRELVRLDIDKGVTSFYVCGSTAEVFLLSSDERKSILETVVDELANNCGIIAHIGSISQDEAIDLAKHAKRNNVDAISSIPPFYYPFSFEEIKSYYYNIVDKVDLPMIIYLFPGFSGVNMDEDHIFQFLCDDRFVGIKFTYNDFYLLNRIKTIYSNKLVLSGLDEMFISGFAAGADGAIGSTFNFMADQFINIKKTYEEGKHEEAIKLQSAVNQVIKVLMRVGMLPGEKEILNILGLDFGICRKPFKAISEEEHEMLKVALNKLYNGNLEQLKI